MTKSFRLIIVIAIIGLLIGLSWIAIQQTRDSSARSQPSTPSTSSNPFGNTQILTANLTVVDGKGGIKNLQVDGMVSILVGQTLISVKVELGAIVNGAFKVTVPTVTATLNPVLVENGGTFSHQFSTPAVVANSTYSVRVTSLQRGPITGQQPTYATVTVP